MSVVAPTELVELAGLARRSIQLRARVRSTVPRDLLIRLRSLFRTHDRLGSRPYQPGDSTRLLILRDLLNRSQLNVRTYYAVSEVFVQVVLDPSRALLNDAQAGPFAVKLAFSLAMAGLWARQSAEVSFLGQQPATPTARRPQHMGGLISALAQVQPVPLAVADYRPLLERELGRPRTNTNLFLVTHVGHPFDRFEQLVRIIQARVRRAVVLPVVSAAEFGSGPVIDPETGDMVALPADHAEKLARHLTDVVELGRRSGVPIEPLLVVNHRQDIETLLPLLVGLP
jgi:hypothetical protein